MTYGGLKKKTSETPASKPKAASSGAYGLRIRDANDASEREADRIADDVMSRGSTKQHWSISGMNMTASKSALPGDEAAEIDGNGRIGVKDAAKNLKEQQDSRVAHALAKGPVRFRVPTTGDLKTLFTSRNVPEDVLKDRIGVALQRMQKEGRLKTHDAVSTIIQKIFPAPGTFDEAAYEAAVDVSDRTKVYQSVLDAETKVTAADKPKLKTVMEDSGKLIDDCVADDANLKSVFGSKQSVAKVVYQHARTALNRAILHMDASITTDYNLDDPETGLGGWARFADQKVHFKASVVKVTDEKGAKVTIIHESSHLADPSVDDKGYYRSPGFESASEDTKVTNAAHYEEVPRRKLGTSKFQNPDGTFKDFKPGATVSGAPSTFDDKVREKADGYLRKAWDKAVDVAHFIREVRKSELTGGTLFSTRRARILEISKLMHLTVHEQPAATASVNQVDVVLAEGIARAMAIIGHKAESQPVPKLNDLPLPKMDPGAVPGVEDIPGPIRRGTLTPIVTDPRVEQYYMNMAEDMAADKIAVGAIKSFGALTGNDADDKKLADWLVLEYGKPI